ncbi:hypothetical protein ARC20_16210 [Stenotrophomonas panacihumi]|uniref:Uncharacterized protein n=1 Tax=Stenotrophomonas panacihumi TaxID=676599 RepID=A0A0R0AAF1_9GAMM|nr:hypothetical protein [Stenotrophomonas panacihumi]KRG37768.1 hypothetical protein ARC20_16210 [Stenotrophomonas panacihumi]PTN56292.1 hypothetical protein C9J98_00795 [Stenotrophomonas panacihumi]
MIRVILLQGGSRYRREQRDDAPELVDYDGVTYSLRAGPRTPQPTDHAWEAVAVYAPDEFNEEEFQEMYETARLQVEELNLKY